MKTLTIGLLILVVMSGHLNADNHSPIDNKITLNLDGTTDILVKGFITPTKDTTAESFRDWVSLINLQMTEPEMRYPTATFRSFLPNAAVSIGELWQIEEEGVLTLLRQLHPNPNLNMHINSGDSYGLWACLRAYNDQFADIVFRIHAEFKFEDGWFTPSQFAGHLIIDRIKEKVTFFQMSVPGGVVNFDINRNHKNASSFGSSMGFCQQMELRAGTQDFLENVEFAESIPQEAAERALILRFYKSQQINWVPPDQVLEMAQTQQKPIHVISIDGPLMDEAC